jgi:dCTP deaminase
MSFWRTETLREKLGGLISGFDKSRIKHCAYELSLGDEVFVTTDGVERKGKQRLTLPGDQVTIPAGQFALLLTEEKIRIPTDAIGFISIKAGKKFGGLVNVSGFHVDPGFEGKLKFSVYNASSRDIVLARGEPLFPLWYASLDGVTGDPYNGDHQRQAGISSTDVERISGEVASPAVMKREVESLKLQVRTIWTLGLALVGAGVLLPKACDFDLSPREMVPQRASVSPPSSDSGLSEALRSRPP